jgi:hypothetical protein
MAEISFKARGKRWPALARRVHAENPKSELVETPDTLTVRGPTIAITRRMVLATCFPDGPENPGTVKRLLYGLALTRKGKLVTRTEDRIVIGDDDGERAMSLRLRPDHRQAIERFALRLGMSRNEFVLQAIEHFVGFLEDSESLPLPD